MTPFSLVYGVEAILYLEVGILLLCVSLKEFTDETFQKKVCLLELGKIDKICLIILQNNLASKTRI